MKNTKNKRKAPHKTQPRQVSSTALPSNITALRKAKGFHTQKAFAEALGVSRSLLSYWENSFFLPTSPNMKKLCEVLDCTVDDLFDWRS